MTIRSAAAAALTLLLAPRAASASKTDAAAYSDKAIQCVSTAPRDPYAIRDCIKKIVSSDTSSRITWRGKVTSRDMAIGVQASGWGTYAVIADDPSSRALYIEFPRGSEAFTKIMDQSSGFGPKGFVFFRATGTFGGYRVAPRWLCGGNPNCYVPILHVRNADDFHNGSTHSVY